TTSENNTVNHIIVYNCTAIVPSHSSFNYTYVTVIVPSQSLVSTTAGTSSFTSSTVAQYISDGGSSDDTYSTLMSTTSSVANTNCYNFNSATASSLTYPSLSSFTTTVSASPTTQTGETTTVSDALFLVLLQLWQVSCFCMIVCHRSEAEYNGGVIAGIASTAAIITLISIAGCVFSLVSNRMKMRESNVPRSKLQSVSYKRPSLLERLELKEVGRREDNITSNVMSTEKDSLLAEDIPVRSDIPVSEFPDYVIDMTVENQHDTSKLAIEYQVDSETYIHVRIKSAHNTSTSFHELKIYQDDTSRVTLKSIPGELGSDYINASFISGYGGNKYIAAQAPLNETIDHFWRMVWEYEIEAIVMLTKCVEMTREKSAQYWPESLSETITPGDRLSVTLSSSTPYAEYHVRKLLVKHLTESDKSVTVTQFHYTAWPDHGVPDNVMSVIRFIRHVRKLFPAASQDQPLLVHCSAGVGRTGTFITLDMMMQQMKAEATLSVCQCVRNLRTQRMKMVQTPIQYEFIHQALSELVVCGETEVTASSLSFTTTVSAIPTTHTTTASVTGKMTNMFPGKVQYSVVNDNHVSNYRMKMRESNVPRSKLESISYMRSSLLERLELKEVGRREDNITSNVLSTEKDSLLAEDIPVRSDIPVSEFPDYVIDMTVENQHDTSKFAIEYQQFNDVPTLTFEVACLYDNIDLNRFRNIYPSPLDETIDHFWRMVWEYEIEAIVMLTKCVEMTREKSAQYWPGSLSETITPGDRLSVTLSSSTPYAEYHVRKLLVKHLTESDKQVTVTQFHYTAWPDHGVPDNVMSVIRFIRHVRKLFPAASQDQPLLVHCSAGVGRTGTFITLDMMMQQMKAEATLSVCQCVRNLRTQRMKMVQTPIQYEFIHQALSELVVCGETEGYKQRDAYIATQGPLEGTVEDFWRMMWEYQCGCIVMLCQLEEDGQESSYPYWPGEEGEEMVCGRLSVRLVKVRGHGDIVERRMEVKENKSISPDILRVKMVQLTSWPLEGLPHPTAIISLIDKLNHVLMSTSSKQTVVMCGDGVVRSGTFLVIHSQLERLKTEGVVDVFQAIKSARIHRPGVIPNTNHYVFCYEVLADFVERTEAYHNFKTLM
ncbi:Receptor-type tyrosine-protein phosphatase zeta, partial [Geodia barretti]